MLRSVFLIQKSIGDNYEDRLVRFVGEVLFFVVTIPKNYPGKYYNQQLIRSSGAGFELWRSTGNDNKKRFYK